VKVKDESAKRQGEREREDEEVPDKAQDQQREVLWWEAGSAGFVLHRPVVVDCFVPLPVPFVTGNVQHGKRMDPNCTVCLLSSMKSGSFQTGVFSPSPSGLVFVVCRGRVTLSAVGVDGALGRLVV